MIRSILLIGLCLFATLARADDPASLLVGGGSLSYGLEAYYPQTDAEDRLLDLVRGADLTKSGTPISVHALNRVAKRYDGNAENDYYGLATAPQSLHVDAASSWTIAAVVKPYATDTYYGVFGCGAADASSWLAIFTGEVVRVQWKKPGGVVALVDAAPTVANRWILIVASYDATTQKMAVSVDDGIPTEIDATGAIATTGAARIGADVLGYVQRFKGEMSHVAKWSRVLSAGEREALYGGGTFPMVDVVRKSAQILFPVSRSLASPVAGMNHTLIANSPNREHAFINSRLVDEPNDFLNGNVASLWHKNASGGNSAMRFLMPGQVPGDERAAIGRGSVYPWDAAFIEATNFAPGAPPDEFRFIQTGVVGGGSIGSFIRHRIKGDGEIGWYAKDGSTRLLTIDLAGNVYVGTTVATTATDGFFRLPSCTGTPTGNAPDGSMVRDSTNHKVYFRSGGNWIALN